MSDKSERLFQAMSDIQDRTIDEAAAGPSQQKRRPHWRRWAALAACLALVAVGVGTFTGVIPILRFGGSAGGAGHDGASTFMSYAGPVFPLTLKEENGAVTAQRDITLDFAPWVPVWVSNEETAALEGSTEAERRETLERYNELRPEGGRWHYSDNILVTDGYTLTNSSDADQTVTALYPFAAGLNELAQRAPTLTLDGTELETALHVGAYSGGFEGVWNGTIGGEAEGSVNLDYADSWEDYRDLLSDGTYLQNALGEGPDVSGIPVIVYEFTDPYSPPEDDEAGITNPTLRAEFNLDYDQTTVLTWGFHGTRFDLTAGYMLQDFSIPQPGERGYREDVYYLLVVGEDIENLTTQGYATGSLDADAPVLEGCGVTVERYESDLDAMLREILGLYWEERDWEIEYGGGNDLAVDFDTYYRAFLEHLLAYSVLSPSGAERYSTGWLEDMAGEVWTIDRVCWLEAEVTIPAGGSAVLSASMTKEASFDYYCAHTENRGISGYDLVTTLGSNLTCTAQTAVLEDRGQIELVRQNFGFDLENGVKSVALDPDVEHYYLEVKRAEGTLPEGPPEG